MKSQRWFRGVDWQMVESRHVPAPWKPNVRGDIDTHYFDKYPETQEKLLSIRAEEQELFEDF